MDFSLLKDSHTRRSVPYIFKCVLAVICSIYVLSACALVSQNECVVTNWHEQGVIVGTAGMSEHEARTLFESCGVAKPTSVRNSYIIGYREGLNTYCTETIGFQTGMAGVMYQEVCPEEVEESFLLGYRTGSDLFLADYGLRAAKVAFASSASPRTFIGAPPSAEHNRFLLEKFPQTKDTARALVSQMRWRNMTPISGEVLRRSYAKRNLTTLIQRCEAAKERAQEQGFVVDDAC